MQQPKNPRLLDLMWLSVRLTWSHNKVIRRRCREGIWNELGSRWRFFVPDTAPGSEAAIVRAVWLGAALASRSLARYPLLPRPVKRRLTWVTRILGRTTGKAVVAAYLAWIWLTEAAQSSILAPDGTRTTS